MLLQRSFIIRLARKLFAWQKKLTIRRHRGRDGGESTIVYIQRTNTTVHLRIAMYFWYTNQKFTNEIYVHTLIFAIGHSSVSNLLEVSMCKSLFFSLFSDDLSQKWKVGISHDSFTSPSVLWCSFANYGTIHVMDEIQ